MTMTRTLCPLDCGWHHDQNEPDFTQPQPFASQPAPEGVDRLILGYSLSRTLVVENALKEHLQTHGLLTWVETVQAAKQRAADAEQRLDLCRHAFLHDGYFTADQIGPDIAPRITERLIKAREAEAAVERVRVVHRISTIDDVAPGRAPYCENCRFQWPCPTIQALEQP